MNNEQRAKSKEQRIMIKDQRAMSGRNPRSLFFANCSLFSALCSLLIVLCSLFTVNCSSMATSAEEYFNIGMAYYDLGKYEDAEKWLNRAKQADKTYAASQYNLGRIAYERKRFDEAVKIFESILKKDPDNILALRAAAYTRIKMGEIETAQKHYSRLLVLVPESSDDGYNHALVLFAMKRYSEAEEILEKYPFAMQESKEAQLLFARSQGKQNKVEAIDNFSAWLSANSDYADKVAAVRARFEYAQVLEHHEFYARALEEFKKAHENIAESSTEPAKNEIRFAVARVLLIAEGESNVGVTEMQGAVTDGFKNIEAIEELINHTKISAANKTALSSIVDNIRREELAEQERQKQAEEQAQEEQANQSETGTSETDSEADAG